jgi:hypothetical protein
MNYFDPIPTEYVMNDAALLGITGSGPEVHLDVFGTVFLVSDKGQILTNHHVAEPWWDPNLLHGLWIPQDSYEMGIYTISIEWHKF